MSTNRSVGRLTATQVNVRSTSTSKKDRSTNLCSFTFADGRQPHSALLRPPASLFRRKTSRQGRIYFLLREFAYRLRSQRRHGSAFHRRSAGPNQAQGRLHPRLSQPDHAPIHSHRAARILRGLRHGALAQSRPLLVHFLRPCSPTRPQATRFLGLTHTAPTSRPTGPIAAHSFIPHERRIRSAGICWAEFIPIGDPHTVPTRSRARLFGLFLRLRPGPHVLDTTRTFIAQHSPLLTTRNLRQLRPPGNPPRHSNPSQLRTRSTTRYLHQRRPLPRLYHPALVPPPTGTS